MRPSLLECKVLEQPNVFFAEVLSESGQLKSNIICGANMPRTYGCQILNGTRIAHRDYYLRTAIAMKLDLRINGSENILKGKVVCGDCGSKMQCKKGNQNGDWHFFIGHTNNRIGANRCTGMYIRKFKIVYHQPLVFL